MSVEVEAGSAAVAEGRERVKRGALAPVVLRDVRLMLVALWLGGAVFFSAAVAPSAFAVLRAQHAPNAGHLAGSIVTRTLSIINTSGFFISLLLLLTAFAFRAGLSRRAYFAEFISLALVACATGVGQWIINARLLALRVAMGRPIDEVDLNDPLRVAFNNLHGYSVIALAVGILAAGAALLLIARRTGSLTS